jgi:hypothetical protein
VIVDITLFYFAHILLGEGYAMRCWKTVGTIFAATGLLIILGLVMPSKFWWFALGVVLIVCGVTLMTKRR